MMSLIYFSIPLFSSSLSFFHPFSLYNSPLLFFQFLINFSSISGSLLSSLLTYIYFSSLLFSSRSFLFSSTPFTSPSPHIFSLLFSSLLSLFNPLLSYLLFSPLFYSLFSSLLLSSLSGGSKRHTRRQSI